MGSGCLGCCSYIASMIWFLSYERWQDNSHRMSSGNFINLAIAVGQQLDFYESADDEQDNNKSSFVQWIKICKFRKFSIINHLQQASINFWISILTIHSAQSQQRFYASSTSFWKRKFTKKDSKYHIRSCYTQQIPQFHSKIYTHVVWIDLFP